MQKNSLISRVIKTELVNWQSFQFLQSENFKSLDPASKAKLRRSIIENNFAQPFYVWQDPGDGVVYCLDGWHRSAELKEMEAEEVNIPKLLPATFIDCSDKQEAARMVIIYSSMYAKVTYEGFHQFLESFDIDYNSIRDQMDIPEFSNDRFDQMFGAFTIDEADESIHMPGSIIVNTGDIFELNGHRIGCGSFEDGAFLSKLMQGQKARILNTDPPYNLPVSLILTTDHHHDFKMAKGEMSDEEFVEFLKMVMIGAIEHTLPGAIHFICMDWRHVWHISEAARQAYGSPVPKQLCVWNKSQMAMGSFYRAKHELVFIFKSGNDKHVSHLELKDRIRTNVWDYSSFSSFGNPDRGEMENHPTPKPVEMIADAILDTTNPGDIVLDFFLGSGTCLIASEQTTRLCYGIDIEPRFIQQIITRYLGYCEKKGIKVSFTHCNGSLTLNDFVNEPIPAVN